MVDIYSRSRHELVSFDEREPLELDRSASANKEREAFDAQFVRSETGIGASAAHVH